MNKKNLTNYISAGYFFSLLGNLCNAFALLNIHSMLLLLNKIWLINTNSSVPVGKNGSVFEYVVLEIVRITDVALIGH